MPTIKEKAEAQFTGQQYEERDGEYGVRKYCTAEYNAYLNENYHMHTQMPFIAYARATKARDEIETKLRAVRMERDKLNKNIADLEADLQAANFTVDAVGAMEVP